MSFIMGIILARHCQTVPGSVWLLLVIVFLLLIIPEKRFLPNRLWYINFHEFSRTSIALVIAMIFFGALRYSVSLPQWTIYDLAWFNDTGTYEIVGRVVDPPEMHNKYTLLHVDVHSLRPLNGVILSDKNHELKGTMLVRLPPDDSIRYADVLDFTGKLQTPPEGSTFSYRDYLATQGIYSYLNYPRYQVIMRTSGNLFKILIFAFRDQAYQKINQFYTQPEASLLSGILLGIETDISEDVEEAFRVTGTTHIIAISGFNIAIITGLFMFLARRVTKNKWKALIIAIIGICVYTTMVGGQASVVRAAIMGSIGLLGKQIGRPQSGVNSLAITAAVMSLFNPLILWDVGFQLSFSATIGLILYAEPLQNSFDNITGEKKHPARKCCAAYIQPCRRVFPVHDCCTNNDHAHYRLSFPPVFKLCIVNQHFNPAGTTYDCHDPGGIIRADRHDPAAHRTTAGIWRLGFLNLYH